MLLLFPAVHATDVVPFINPTDSYSHLQSFIANSNELKIATYTFTSQAIANMLLSLHANITIIADASPVGGFPEISNNIFCQLLENNISVYLYTGPLNYHHAKYIVKSDSVLVSTENLGDDGYPSDGQGNRGWSVIVDDEAISKEFSRIFQEDLKNSKPFICSQTAYNSITTPTTIVYDVYNGQSVRAVFAPDATSDILKLINSAEKSIYVEQFYIYKYWGVGINPFLDAILNKARKGVVVKILLDSTYYNLDKADKNSNINTISYLNEIAGAENLRLEAKLADAVKLDVVKFHIKGVIVDEKTAFVSSINWNRNSATNNREAGVLIEGSAAKYFSNAFLNDWNNGEASDITGLITENPNNALIIFLLVVIVAVIVYRFKRFATV
ncbi:MAG: phospholipase D-like domain-containing protein [Candidatus Aenigmatarchaeota archaeon]